MVLWTWERLGIVQVCLGQVRDCLSVFLAATSRVLHPKTPSPTKRKECFHWIHTKYIHLPKSNPKAVVTPKQDSSGVVIILGKKTIETLVDIVLFAISVDIGQQLLTRSRKTPRGHFEGQGMAKIIEQMSPPQKKKKMLQ